MLFVGGFRFGFAYWSVCGGSYGDNVIWEHQNKLAADDDFVAVWAQMGNFLIGMTNL